MNTRWSASSAIPFTAITCSYRTRADSLTQLRRVAQFRHMSNIDVYRIAEQPGERTVRADIDPPVQQRMQRIDADEVGAVVAGPRGELAEVGEIADAPVRSALDRVQVGRDPERAPAAAKDVGRCDTAR